LLGVEEVPQAFQHGGFAGSHFTREHHESLAALHAVDQVGESFLMLRAPEQERRVRAHVEGILGETKEGFVHLRYAHDRRMGFPCNLNMRWGSAMRRLRGRHMALRYAGPGSK